MTIDWTQFTPLHALIGGLLIGMAAALYLLGNGRVAGVAGILAGPLRALRGGSLAGEGVRIAFLVGLVAAPWLWRAFAALPAASVDIGSGSLVLAGLLVGFGVRLGDGCTSGHGVCGLSRLSLRSLVNVLAFMAAGVVTVFVMRHLL